MTYNDAPGMDPEVKAEWLEMLRSGKINQGAGKLHTADTNEDGTQRHEFCCLGVLCELAVAAGVVERVDLSDTDGYRDADQKTYGYAPTSGPNAGHPHPHYPPVEVAVWAGLPYDESNPYVDTDTGRKVIANVNDEGATFSKIADIIDTQL